MDLILILLIIGIPALASLGIKTTYKKYLKVNGSKNLTGQEVARKILDSHGLNDMYVVETSGTLSDHYDPTRKVVRLSRDIFSKTSISSVAVAAHECGHAIQDKEGYAPMRIRSAIYPVVKVATSVSYYIILIGFILEALDLVYLGIACTCLGLLFQIVTLPVEFNASKRALEELEKLNLVSSNEKDGASKVLAAAALTYVAGVLASALQVLRLILAANRRD